MTAAEWERLLEFVARMNASLDRIEARLDERDGLARPSLRVVHGEEEGDDV